MRAWWEGRRKSSDSRTRSRSAAPPGTLQVTVDKNGLLPSLTYGDARDGRYLTAASLSYQPGTKFALGHMAEGSFGNPPKRLYTGIAMYNPNRWNTNIEVEAYSPKNDLLARTQFTLQGASRLSQTIGQILPTITQQNGGTVIIKSDLPILVFEVFGQRRLGFPRCGPAGAAGPLSPRLPKPRAGHAER